MSLQMYHPLESFLFDAFDLPSTTRHSKSGPRTVSPNYNTVFVDGTGLLEIELPGVSKERLQVDVRDNVLFVTGSRGSQDAETTHEAAAPEDPSINAEKFNTSKDEATADGKQNEVTTDSKPAFAHEGLKYSAKFKLAYDADINDIKAEFKDGLLKVRIPRRAEAEPRRLTVS